MPVAPLPLIVVLSSMACLGGGGNLKIKLCFDFHYYICMSETFLILRRLQRDIVLNIHRYCPKYTSVLS